ncbi:MAG TPA: alpha/beta hydrolase-fold protein [Mycobacterium sp.]|nr:alpha/beta hydrolase-fold protein [Mycobacterium sp.]
MALVSELTRRAALRFGVGAAAGAAGLFALDALLDPVKPAASPAPAPHTPPDPASAGNVLPTRESGSFLSAARGGLPTNWIIARPPGQTAPLRPVIALHCKDGDAAWVMDLGVEDALAQLVRAGKPPFAVVAVDGGNTFWRRHGSGQDSGTMVTDELIPMLAAKGMDTARVGFMGWSMGGYGAMLLGARLGPARTAGICAISPALYMTYWGAPPGAFDSVDDWRVNSPYGLIPQLASIPLRIDCGTSDPFYVATNQFVNRMNPRPVTAFDPGGHDDAYWRAHLKEELNWLDS